MFLGGIVHQYVQLIVFCTNALNQRVDGLGVPLIELHGFRAAAGIINGRYRRVCRISGTNIGAINTAAVPAKRLPNGAADVPRRAGDQGNGLSCVRYSSPNEISACMNGLNSGSRYSHSVNRWRLRGFVVTVQPVIDSVGSRMDAIQPLTSIRVLDLTQVFAGPYCTYQLALGAQVIKVELSGGEMTRFGGALPELAEQGLGLSFCTQNAQKNCIELDLKDSRHVAKVLDLAAEADIFIQNYWLALVQRLGLGEEALA